MTGDGTICAGPGDGRRCATCTGGATPRTSTRAGSRRSARASSRGVTGVLAVSEAVRRTLLGAGYPAELVEVVRQGMPHDRRDVGAARPRSRAGPRGRPGRAADGRVPRLRVPAQGAAAAGRGGAAGAGAVRVLIHGEVPGRVRTDAAGAGRARRVRAARRVLDGRAGVRAGGRRRRGAAVDVVGLRAAGGGRVPGGARAAGGAAARRAGRGGARRGRRAGGRRRCRPTRWRARWSGSRARTGCWSGCRRGIEPPHRSRRTWTSWRRATRGERPSRRQADAAPAARVRRDRAAPPARDPRRGRRAGARSGAARVQRLGTSDPPLPHAADVELRTTWPPATRAASSGRLVIVQPAGAEALSTAALPPHDELWVGFPADADGAAARARRPPAARRRPGGGRAVAAGRAGRAARAGDARVARRRPTRDAARAVVRGDDAGDERLPLPARRPRRRRHA